MSVDRAEVERIARLAKLSLDDVEADRLTDDMNRILEHAERLRALEADDREAPVAPVDARRPPATRSPQAESPDALEASLERFAPDAREGFFVVPPPPGVGAGPGEAREVEG
ncbi:MAG: aspartyl/glutamyl-tRNA amidotransferase subunit C [Gemmatimonadota bacterium]|nr:aspartyl/glutamyl-tRNA amidotransferase subunit C [Gemmatimonadota bacterium]